ncbi:cbb3-type cytochrome oxidase assembly protein CcoS [bacterium]|nr:cbb3-type cytochrome oxidase assembly protein CcoS [bacterium]
MNILYWLMALAVIFILVFVVLYLWAVRSGQFDDLESPAHRILLDEADSSKDKDGK